MGWFWNRFANVYSTRTLRGVLVSTFMSRVAHSAAGKEDAREHMYLEDWHDFAWWSHHA